jgi:hypothetical protein
VISAAVPLAIPLRGRDGRARAYTLVDMADYERATDRRWSLYPTGYAATRVRLDGRYYTTQLARYLLGLTRGDGLEADHINGDKLDNRRANLRVCTAAENRQNVPPAGGSSRHRGVSFNRGYWMAQCRVDGKTKTLGRFDTEEEAARVAADARAEHMPFAVETR